MTPSALASAELDTAAQQTILITGVERGQVERLQRELRNSGYQLRAALGHEEAAKLLASNTIHLGIVTANGGSGAPVSRDGPSAPSSSSSAESAARAAERAAASEVVREAYELSMTLQPVAQARRVPLLLISPLWAPGALAQSLASGTDYFLFAPYQQQDLARAIRGALLNGPLAEPAQVLPEVAVMHGDRRHAVTAGRARLARLGFSVFEQLQQSRAALSWTQAELEELRQQLRQEREQAKLALMLPEVVQGIAHDFTNLLETVGAAATVLRTSPAQPVPYRDAMDAALAQAGTLIGALQNWTQWEKGGDAEAIDVGEVVREVIEGTLLPLRAPNIRVRVQAESLPRVWTNRSLLFRSLTNLVWNAVQAMPSGGLLSVLGYTEGKGVVLEIGDTGVGISEQDQERIFNPHFSTKQGHSGIGLFLVRSLVRRGGGEIRFASRTGRGSTFAVSFPVADHEPSTAPPSRPRRRRAVRQP